MIIFGTRGVNSTIKSGDFSCPQCQEIRPYRHRKVTKFFTLYFIPLIPYGSAGEYVECGNCKGTFVTRVLENRNDSQSNGNEEEEFMAIYEKAIRHSMVLIMLADGVIDDNEKDMVLKIVNKFGSTTWTMLQLDNYIQKVKIQNEDITTYLKSVGPYLNEEGKETIIKCALAVADSDGYIDTSEKDMIYKMGEVLEMTKSHLKGIFSDFTES